MNTIKQEADQVIVNHNPDCEKCAFENCQEILFGQCILVTITETNPGGSKSKQWLLCSPECYVGFDAWFEHVYMMWAGDDHIATIDGGMPDDWGQGA